MRLFRCVHCARSLYIYLYIGGLKAWNISTKFISFHSYIFLFCLNFFFFVSFSFYIYLFILIFNSKRPLILLSEMSWLLILYIYIFIWTAALYLFLFIYLISMCSLIPLSKMSDSVAGNLFFYILNHSYYALYRMYKYFLKA